MDTFSRRHAYQRVQTIEAELWARELRHRWFVRTAGLLAERLAGTIARAGSRTQSRLSPRHIARGAVLDAAVRPRSAGG